MVLLSKASLQKHPFGTLIVNDVAGKINIIKMFFTLTSKLVFLRTVYWNILCETQNNVPVRSKSSKEQFLSSTIFLLVDGLIFTSWLYTSCNLFHCIVHTINYKHNLKHIQHHQSPAEKLPVTVANFFRTNPICDLFLSEQEKHNPKTAVLISHKDNLTQNWTALK